MSLEEVAMRTGHEVSMEVDFYFMTCWWSTRDFKPAVQASPKAPTKPYYYYIKH
jgi:hypothetical protein